MPIHTFFSAESGATATSAIHNPTAAPTKACQVVISSAATVTLQASLDNSNWINLRASTASEGYSFSENWKYLRATISGNDGNVTLLMNE